MTAITYARHRVLAHLRAVAILRLRGLHELAALAMTYVAKWKARLLIARVRDE